MAQHLLKEPDMMNCWMSFGSQSLLRKRRCLFAVTQHHPNSYTCL